MINKYVDGAVPHWMTGYDDDHGIDLVAIVVFVPDGMTPRSFEASCRTMERRRESTAKATVELARGSDPRFRLIDATTVAAARNRTSAEMGDDYLDRFMQDTLEVAMSEVGNAVWRAREEGVSVTPNRYGAGIQVEAAKSYASKTDLRSRSSRWNPSVRLTVKLSLDGPCAAVEKHAVEIRRAVSACGPLTTYLEKGRPPLDRFSVLTSPRLAELQAEACALRLQP